MMSALITRLAVLWTRLRSIRGDRSGNFGMITTLLIIPLIMLAGFAVDLANTLEVRERVRNVADATVLEAVSTQNWIRYLQPGSDVSRLNGELQAAAKTTFQAMLREQGLPNGAVTADAAVAFADRRIKIELSYSLGVPTIFAAIAGFSEFQIGGLATGESSSVRYKSLYVLVDNSTSMALPADEAAARKMKDLTDTTRVADPAERGCIFACHVLEYWNDAGTAATIPDFYEWAHAAGIPLRIDIVKDALDGFVTRISEARTVKDQYTMRFYGLCFPFFGPIRFACSYDPMTSDIPTLRSSIRDIEVMKMLNPGNMQRALTWMNLAMETMDKEISTQGDGLTPQKPEKLLLIFSDGVVDELMMKGGGCRGTVVSGGAVCVEPIDPRQCALIKARGINVLTVHVRYPDLPTVDKWREQILPIRDKIAPAMKECASDGMYFEVDYGDPMQPTMDGIFAKIAEAPRLTN